MSNHTPGPWSVREEPNALDAIADEEVGSVSFIVESRKAGAFIGGAIYVEDDARLIAAAPELLDALQEMLSRFGGATDKETPAEKQARAAITKATQAPL